MTSITHKGLSRVGYYACATGLLLAGAAARIAPLTDNRFHSDEALFGTLGRLIASGHDPWLAHTTLLVDKPPLFYYTLAGAMTLFGSGELGARVPGLFAEIISMALVMRLAQNWWKSKLAGLISLMIAALSPFAILFAPTAFSDPQYVVWFLAALAAVSERRRAWAGVFVGLSIACKQTGLLAAPMVILIGVVQNAGRMRTSAVLTGVVKLIGAVSVCAVALWGWDTFRSGTANTFWLAGLQANNPGRLVRSTEVWPRAFEWSSYMQYFTGSPIGNGLILLSLCAAGIIAARPANRARRSAIFAVALACLITYLATNWLIAVPVLDRYLLPMVYVVAILAGRSIQVCLDEVGKMAHIKADAMRIITGSGVIVLGLLLTWPAIEAARSQIPVGGDHGGNDGIDQMAAYLAQRPWGTVVYTRGLGWLADFYLFDALVYNAHFETPDGLASDLEHFGASPDERYVLLSRYESLPEIDAAIRRAGYRVALVFSALDRHSEVSMRLFRISQ